MYWLFYVSAGTDVSAEFFYAAVTEVSNVDQFGYGVATISFTVEYWNPQSSSLYLDIDVEFQSEVDLEANFTYSGQWVDPDQKIINTNVFKTYKPGKTKMDTSLSISHSQSVLPSGTYTLSPIRYPVCFENKEDCIQGKMLIYPYTILVSGTQIDLTAPSLPADWGQIKQSSSATNFPVAVTGCFLSLGLFGAYSVLRKFLR